MKVTLRRESGARFEAKSESGQVAWIDGPPEVGGRGEGVRPMEMLLMGLAGCAAVDVLHILAKQRQPIEDLEIAVDGQRADGIPAVFTEIHLHFEASGAVDPRKLEHAVSLSMEKYCSAAKMLEKTARITASSSVRAA